jgi:hypothetical protein
MTDTTDTPAYPLPSIRARTNFVIVVTLFHFATIAALCVFGDMKNSLHTSAMAWSFTAYMGIMMAFLFGINIDLKNFYSNNRAP